MNWFDGATFATNYSVVDHFNTLVRIKDSVVGLANSTWNLGSGQTLIPTPTEVLFPGAAADEEGATVATLQRPAEMPGEPGMDEEQQQEEAEADEPRRRADEQRVLEGQVPPGEGPVVLPEEKQPRPRFAAPGTYADKVSPALLVTSSALLLNGTYW